MQLISKIKNELSLPNVIISLLSIIILALLLLSSIYISNSNKLISSLYDSNKGQVAAATFNLATLAANSAAYLGPYDSAQMLECPLGPTTIIGYSKFTYVPTQQKMMMWGGGHAATFRDDVDALNLSTFVWASEYNSTPYSALTLANLSTSTGSWISTGRPVARHSYDLLTYANNVNELVLLSKPFAGSDCMSGWRATYDQVTYSNPGKIWHYNVNSKTWRATVNFPSGWEIAPASEYDPISGKILVIDRYGIYTYDAATETLTKVKNHSMGELAYAQNLIYFPPNQKMYYVLGNGDVFEVTLNRSNPALTTIVKVTGVTGTLPPALLPTPPDFSDDAETGWAYDSVNNIIGGGVRDGKFYAYDPITKVWSVRTINLVNAPAGITLGTMAASHVLDYDPVNNFFIFITIKNKASNIYEKATFAYRYGTGSGQGATSTNPIPTDATPPSTPQSLIAGQLTSSSVALSWQSSSDNVGVAGYRVFVNGAQYATVTQTLLEVTGLNANTLYNLEVEAFDSANNKSGKALLATTTKTVATINPPTGCALNQNSTSNAVINMPTLGAKPALGQSFNDASFGSCVKRVTDAVARGTDAPVHVYSQNQAWNSDNTLFLLNNNEIIDSNTLALAHLINFKWPAQGAGVRWSPIDPNVLYYFDSLVSTSYSDPDGFNCSAAHRLIKYKLTRTNNSVSGVRELLHCFNEYKQINDKAGFQELSDDGRYLAVVGVLNNGNQEVFSYDVINKQKGTILNIPAPNTNIDWVAMSPSGKYVMVQYASNGYARYQGMETYDRVTGQYLGKVTLTTGHGDLTLGTDGKDYFVGANAANTQFLADKSYIIKAKIPVGVMFNSNGSVDVTNTLATGATVPLMDIVWGNGTHTSCRNINDLGYCIVSTNNLRAPTEPWLKYQSEIIKVYLDSTMSTPKVERLGHTRTSQYFVDKAPYATCPMSSYWAAPHASINSTGDKIIFHSTWGDDCKSENYVLTFTSQMSGAGNPIPTPTPSPGSCGSSNGSTVASIPTTNLCSSGNATTVAGTGPWTWSCNGINGGAAASCSASKAPTPISGSCGSSNSQSFTTAPTTNLCSVGTASTLSGSGPWSWSCSGSNGGASPSCSASKITLVAGVCGSANTQALTSKPSTNLCSVGTSTTVAGTGPWTWSCNGSNGGAAASCSAIKTADPVAPTPIIGSCGTSNSQSLTSIPTVNLCATGTSTSVSGSGPWNWTCNGFNGGTNASCSATRLVQSSGSCGSSNSQSFTTAPTTNLCSVGTASTLSGSGPWSWSCSGINGGTAASCSANLTNNNNNTQVTPPTSPTTPIPAPISPVNTPTNPSPAITPITTFPQTNLTPTLPTNNNIQTLPKVIYNPFTIKTDNTGKIRGGSDSFRISIGGEDNSNSSPISEDNNKTVLGLTPESPSLTDKVINVVKIIPTFIGKIFSKIVGRFN